MRKNWAKLIEEFQASGEDEAYFCKRRGLRPSELRAAQRRLGKKPAGFVQIGGACTIKLEVQPEGVVNILDLPASTLPKLLSALADALR